MGADESKLTHQKNKDPFRNKYKPPEVKSHLHSPDFKPPVSYQPPRRSRSSERDQDNKENRRIDYHDPKRRNRDADARGRDSGPRHKRSNSDSSVFVTRESNHERRRNRSPRRRAKEEEQKGGSSPRRRDTTPEKTRRKKKKSPDRRHGEKEDGEKKRKKKRKREKEKVDEKSETNHKTVEGEDVKKSVDEPAAAPSKSDKADAPRDTKREKGRRKKKKEALDKRNSAYHSAPDLTKLDESRVGAWLNSGGYYWPPPDGSATWQEHPYPFPFPPYIPTQARIEESGNGEPIVDGIGYPMAPMFPPMYGGSPNGTLRRPTSEIYSGSPQQFGGSPYFTLPYAYPYFQPLFFQNPNMAPNDGTSNRRSKHRSRSHDHDVAEAVDRSKSSSPGRRKKRPSREQETQSESQPPTPSGPTYVANQAIDVDDVKLASVVSKHQRIPSPLLSSSSGEQSISGSSLNDVIMDDIKVFQPLSSKEVFIDGGTPEKSAPPPGEGSASASSGSSESSHERQVVTVGEAAVPVEVSPRSDNPPPIMTLCEKESIVATSFVTNAGKVFCLTRSKSGERKKVDSFHSEKVETPGSQPKQDQPPKTQEKKKDDGTWFQLTGSPLVPRVAKQPKPTSLPTIKPNNVIKPTTRSISTNPSVTANRQELMEGRLFTTAASRSSVTPRSAVRPVVPPPVAPKPPIRRLQSADAPSAPVGSAPQSNYRTLNEYRALQKQGRAPEVETNHVAPEFHAPSRTSSTDNTSFEMDDSSSSSDSDDIRYRSNSSLTEKLVRIDSHDSFTMRRRMRTHRRHSQNEGPFERRATIGSISKDDLMKAQSSVTSPVTRSSVTVSTPTGVNPFKNADAEDITPFLTRAKSEEVLKEDMSKSSEELMIKWSPKKQKETLQERAARILGLSSQQLAEAKRKQMQQHDPAPSYRARPASDVTPGDVAPESESFAVSVTSSMIEKKEEKYHVMDVVNGGESSGDDASTISHDSSATPSGLQDNSAASLGGDTYTVHVSDSVLEERVPCNVKPHPQSNPATEYRIPDDVLGSSGDDDTSDDASDWSTEGGVSEGQARIVASYSNNIYANSPAASANAYSSQMSDETTESESVSARPAGPEQAGAFRGKTNVAVTQQPTYQKRLLESPVPVATHSAPLTPEELDIVMQLYNSADETASNGSDESRKRRAPGAAHDDWKQKVANAIGYDLERPRAAPRRSPNLERVEDFEIKVFPGPATANGNPPTAPSASVDKKGDVIEAMQSVGLDPEQSWVVSL